MPTYHDTALYSSHSCGIDLEFPGPASVAEYDRLSGQSGHCLEDAVQHIIVHDYLEKWQELFAVWVEERTKIPRSVSETVAEAALRSRASTDEAKRTAKAPPAPRKESVPIYIRRVIAQVDQATVFEIEAYGKYLASLIHIIPKRRGPRQKVIFAGSWKKIESIMEQDPSFLEQKVSEWLALVPNFVPENDATGFPTPHSLCLLLEAADRARLIQND